jgi:hypothetical protein
MLMTDAMVIDSHSGCPARHGMARRSAGRHGPCHASLRAAPTALKGVGRAGLAQPLSPMLDEAVAIARAACCSWRRCCASSIRSAEEAKKSELEDPWRKQRN